MIAWLIYIDLPKWRVLTACFSKALVHMSPRGLENHQQQQISASENDNEKQLSPLDGKEAFIQDQIESACQNSDGSFGILDSERDIVTHIISVHDDPTLNPWTLRAFVVGFGLSAFGGVLGKSYLPVVLLFGVEMFGQRRFTTSNQYGRFLPVNGDSNNCK